MKEISLLGVLGRFDAILEVLGILRGLYWGRVGRLTSVFRMTLA